jgi:hypothetical protein
VVGVPADGEGKDNNAGSEVPYLLHYGPPCLICVVKVSVGQAGIPTLSYTQDLGGTIGLVRSELGAASGPSLSRGEIEDPGPVTRVCGLEEGTGAGQLDVVAVGSDRQDVDRHRGNKA